MKDQAYAMSNAEVGQCGGADRLRTASATRAPARNPRLAFGCLLLLLAICGAVPAAQAEDVRIGGSGAGLAIVRLLADAFVKKDPQAKVTVLPSLGSSGGIKALAAGAVGLAISSRELTDAERQQDLRAFELGRTPFVFAVPLKNPVNGLTLTQLVDIYSGRTEQWPDGVKIRLILRPHGDASSEMIRSMSPAMRVAETQAEGRPGMLISITDQDAEDNLERVPGALGVTSLGQIMAEQRPLKGLSLDGVQPSVQNIANGSYAYANVLTLVTGPKTSPWARRFVEFVRSPPGQDVLRRTGYLVQ
jgi:phosphate transport system substrate-binding protein